MWRYLLLFFVFLTAFTNVNAQVEPPKLLCTSGNDTLLWQLPNNTCGAFLGYQIYSSSNYAGPYTLLTEITTLSQTTYYNPNLTGATIYYFMQSHYDCPGETVLSSDTLDNRSPEKATITGVSVNGSNIEISWQPSPSTKTIGYVIYRQIPSGLVPIDTIYAGTTYIDSGAQPNDKVEYYDVLALDACDNTSLFNDSLCNSVLLSSSFGVCTRSIDLSWNLYNYWQEGIEQQEVWVSVDGGLPYQHAVIAADAISYQLESLEKDKEYCVFIKAKKNNDNIFVNSNIICQIADIIQPMRDMAIRNINVLPNNDVEVSWVWDTTAAINSASVCAHLHGDDVIQCEDYPLTDTLLVDNYYLDKKGGAGKNSVEYSIHTNDDCDSTAISTSGSTIFLQGAVDDNHDNILNWTAFDLENSTVLHYEIYKSTATGFEQIGQVDGNTTTYKDEVNADDLDGGVPCFYVKAAFTVILPGNNVESLESSSNVACVEQVATIYTPNAFSPKGINRAFKPVVVFGKIAKYQLLIFDRYGNLLFESHDIDIGWNGKSGDKKIRQGLYVYQIKVVQENGNVVNDSGTVFLMR